MNEKNGGSTNNVTIDYEQIQLKVGLEVHQQLSTTEKLFCACPPFKESEKSESLSDADKIRSRFPIQFTRVLRATTSELGETDPAAKFESRREIQVKYLSNEATSCLVEADEEPPHPINAGAVDTALIFALALKSRVVDEIHVMRKIVVDGSNTSGFQRTAVVSLGGHLEYDGGRVVDVQSISVEEDAARAIRMEEKERSERTYVLDRLGTPLVEVALAPIEGKPESIKEAASSLGRLIRSSGRTARGLGTIRQDLNISVLNGAVIEVKGVQKLEQIVKVVQFEAARQKFFNDLAREIRTKTGPDLQISVADVTDLFLHCSAKAIKESFSANGAKSKVACILVKNFSGFFAKENEFRSRLGKELASIAKSYGLGGVFHSDELPNYGISQEEIASLRTRISASERDGFVLLTGSREAVEPALDALVERLCISTRGLPAETRAATPKGDTVFLRPRPGAARMYPETDIPLIVVTPNRLRSLAGLVPEPWDKQVNEFGSKFKLSPQLAEQLYDSDRREVFVKAVELTNLSQGFLAYSLVDTVQNLSREGVEVDDITNEQFLGALIALDQGKFAKEALPELLRVLASNRTMDLEKGLEKSKLGAISEEELQKIVKEAISKNMDMVRSKGLESRGAIMGKVMQSVRGKIDGKIVSETVSRELKKALSL